MACLCVKEICHSAGQDAVSSPQIRMLSLPLPPRMVYLCIKDICPSADEVIIVTSSLMKDMNSKTDLYRSNSVRVLCKIIDSQLLMQVWTNGRVRTWCTS